MSTFNRAPQRDVVSIGAFQLLPAERLLLKDDVEIRLGGRAFDLLVALAERPGEVVSQRELLAKVWPNVIVEEGALRFQVAALRKALEGDGARYLFNVSGRGYCLVAPVTRVEAPADTPAPAFPLPPAPAHMVGREDEVREVCAQVLAQRFVSVVGGGGVGKTIVARAVAHRLLQEFRGAVCFVELASLDSQELLVATVVSAFHLRVNGPDPISELIAYVRDRRILLVLDTCEHLIAEAAGSCERLIREAPGVHILATSRESLRAEAEHIYRLPPLASPAEDTDLGIADALAYPAVQLFVDRMTSAGFAQGLREGELRTVGQMCRQLGGNPLAIELAAGRVATLGVDETAASIDTGFALLWPGRRTSPSRQQTLNATLDWSYNLLSAAERMVLRRLSVFAGVFSQTSALAVAGGSLDRAEADAALSGLVAKYLVSLDPSGPTKRYRLLDTTRSYGEAQLREAREWADARRNHARHFADRLRRGIRLEVIEDDGASSKDLPDIRAALGWAFGAGGDPVLGIEIAASAGPILLNRGLLSECRMWMTKADIACVTVDGARPEFRRRVQNALATAEHFTHGRTRELALALASTVKHAGAEGDPAAQFSSYLVLWAGEIRANHTADALRTAENCAALADLVQDPAQIAMAEWMLGHSKHHAGQFAQARDHLLRYLSFETEAGRQAQIKATGYDRRTDALTSLAHSFRALGRLDEAAQWGEEAVAGAAALEIPLPLIIARASMLTHTVLVEPDTGVIERAASELLEQAQAHAIQSDVGYALTILGICQARRGEVVEGARLMGEGMRLLRKEALEAFVRALFCDAALEAGALDLASHWAPDLEPSDQNRECWCSPEVYRVNGVLAAALGNSDDGEAKLLQALQLARWQDSAFWELRGAMSLGRLWSSQGRKAEALAGVQAVYGRFRDGHSAADLQTAQQLIEVWRA